MTTGWHLILKKLSNRVSAKYDSNLKAYGVRIWDHSIMVIAKKKKKKKININLLENKK